ncbi:MAG: hypothetical protein MUO64_19835 [Anaerolineales bacterium]|nr:hypothetical protein [Anaerolineales bacterium]
MKCKPSSVLPKQDHCSNSAASTWFTKKHPEAVDDIRLALTLLSEEAFLPKLRSQKLKGQLEGSWACSAAFDIRIVFKFVDFKGTEAILLETIGTHQEEY